MGFISQFLYRIMHGRQTAHYQKRFTGRRQQIMAFVLYRHYLDPHEIARRAGVTHSIVSKTLSTAYRDGEPLERIKRRVLTPQHVADKKRCETVWCYRLKNGGVDILQSGTFHTDHGIETAQQISDRLLHEVEQMRIHLDDG